MYLFLCLFLNFLILNHDNKTLSGDNLLSSSYFPLVTLQEIIYLYIIYKNLILTLIPMRYGNYELGVYPLTIMTALRPNNRTLILTKQ